MDSITQTNELAERISAAALRLEDKVIGWRRDIHQNPELSYHETRTAALVADHLKQLGYEVRTDVGDTGVVGILKGGKPGGCVALRADMDALPVEEKVDLPFASKVKAPWMGGMTGVMHACGHDAHVAILMGVAEILMEMKAELPGTVKLLFQPNEEGHEGRPSGAQAMIDDGALADPAVNAVIIATGVQDAAISPDGTKLAWVRRVPEGRIVEIANPDGSGAVSVVPATSVDGAAWPRFSPDGRRLVFSAVSPLTPVPTVTPLPRRSAGWVTVAEASAARHGLPMDQAKLVAKEAPASNAPTSPGPLVYATPSISCFVFPAVSRAFCISGSSFLM